MECYSGVCVKSRLFGWHFINHSTVPTPCSLWFYLDSWFSIKLSRKLFLQPFWDTKTSNLFALRWKQASDIFLKSEGEWDRHVVNWHANTLGQVIFWSIKREHLHVHFSHLKQLFFFVWGILLPLPLSLPLSLSFSFFFPLLFLSFSLLYGSKVSFWTLIW